MSGGQPPLSFFIATTKAVKVTLHLINIIFVTLYFIKNQINQFTQEIKQRLVIVVIGRITKTILFALF